MAIIMRSSGQKRDQGDKKKQIYTWVGCGLVAVLTLISVVPNMGSEPKAPDYSKFSSSRMQDLAAMPFGTDAEAAMFLRDNPEYAGVSNAELLGSLFSAEDRKERQEQDKAEGVPPPPDPEYRAIVKQKELDEKNKQIQENRIQKNQRDKEEYDKRKKEVAQKERDRAQKAAQKKNAKQNQQQVRNQKQTTPGTLASNSSRLGSTGGSSGVTGSIWRTDSKDIKNNNNSMPASHATTAQDLAFAKNMGRGDLYTAAVESSKGANAVSAEGAAEGALDAFQKDVAAEDLAQDEAELGLDELPTGLNEDLQDDLQRALSEDVNEQAKSNEKSSNTAKGKEYSVNENCMDSNGKYNWSCFWGQAAMKGIELVGNILTSWASSGFSTGNRYHYFDNGTVFDTKTKTYYSAPQTQTTITTPSPISTPTHIGGN